MSAKHSFDSLALDNLTIQYGLKKNETMENQL